MTDIFLSYKREDEARMARLVAALEKAGLSVWWDRGLPGGGSWRENIQAALDAAKCVVVCWTRDSVGPAGDFVRDEAGQAKARGVLVPVILERGVRPPLGFGEIQAIDLAHWRGDAKDPFFLDLAAACQAKIAGRAVPPAKGPMARLARRLTLGSLASAAAAGAVAFALNFLSVQNHACALPQAQPGLADACGALGLGGQPTREARLAFAALPPGDCAALQDFRTRFETSPLRALADSRLAARTVIAEERWTARERRLALFAPGAVEAAARAAAARRASQLCQGFTATQSFRLLGANAGGDFACEAGTCGVTGEAVCQVEEREVVERETCAGG